MEKLAIIIGPTAVGKTALALEIASLIDGEIISGDSMQVYRGMDVGTAKIKPNEMYINNRLIPHHFIDVLDPWENYSVANFQKEAKEKISEINARRKIPIIVGGTGLYVQSIIDPYEFTLQENDPHYREEIIALAEIKGKDFLHDMLKRIDPISADNIHPNNLKRVVRALEVYHITGKPISSSHKVDFEKEPSYNLAYIGLTMERALLYERIEIRVDRMLEAGLVNEVKNLLSAKQQPSKTAMQALGYKEIVAYLKGEISLDDAVIKIKTETKHFAKRQLTWFKRDRRIKWYNVTKESNIKELASKISLEICRTINIGVE